MPNEKPVLEVRTPSGNIYRIENPAKPAWPEHFEDLPSDIIKECNDIMAAYEKAPTRREFCQKCERRTWQLWLAGEWHCSEEKHSL